MKNIEKMKIMVVDDEENFRLSLSAKLERKGYHTISATNGYHALEMLKLQSVDLLITDLKMPAMSGEELLEEIRQRGHRIPSIVLSGFFSSSLEDQLNDLGVFTCLQKPISQNKIFVSIEACIKELQTNIAGEGLTNLP